MTQHVYLVGADDVARAGREIQAAADSLSRSIAYFEESMQRDRTAPAHCFRPSSTFYRSLSRESSCLFAFCTWLRRVKLRRASELNYDERARVLKRITAAERWLAELRKALET